MSWRLAESLKKLREQLNVLYPNRDRQSDGSIGDERHQKAGTSDHLPNKNGVVTAIDVTNDIKILAGQRLVDVLVKNKDPRIKYLIFNRQIISSKQQPWVWRKYTGANAHQHHVHISVNADAALYDAKSEWNLEGLDSAAGSSASNPAKNSLSSNQAKKENTNPATNQPPIYHLVQSGDTLSSLGKEYSVTARQLKKWNKLKSDVIKIGQKLRVQ